MLLIREQGEANGYKLIKMPLRIIQGDSALYLSAFGPLPGEISTLALTACIVGKPGPGSGISPVLLQTELICITVGSPSTVSSFCFIFWIDVGEIKRRNP